MVSIRRTYRGGSIANFVIVGIILVLSLVGGLYYLKNYGNEFRKDIAIAEYEKEKTKSEDNETEIESEKTDDEVESDGSVNEEINISEELPTTGPNDFSNLIAIFFLSLAFSYYSSSIYQKSRF